MVTSRRQVSAAVFAVAFQDMQNPRYHTHFVPPSTGVHTHRAISLPWWVRRCVQRKTPGISCGDQMPEDVHVGFRQNLQGTSNHPHALPLLIFNPAIMPGGHLPLIGILTDPCCFLILTAWMPNGNVIQYARSNPRANRL